VVLAGPRDPSDAPPRDPGNGFTRLIALVATLALVAAVVVMQFAGRNGGAGGAGGPAGTPSAEIAPPDLQMLLMGRMAMGVEALTLAAGASGAGSSTANAQQLMSQLDSLAAGGPVRERVRSAMVAAELEGVDKARERLDEAEAALVDLVAELRASTIEYDDEGEPVLDDATNAELTRIETLQSDIDALRAIYASDDASGAPIDQDTRDGLLARHGYFGEVALTHGLEDSDPARRAVLNAGMRTMVTLIVAFTIGVLALVAGFALFVVALVKAMSRRGLKRRYAPPSFGGSVYLETFTLFMLGFIAVSILAGALSSYTSFPVEYVLVWALLLVPFWPLVRGQPLANHKHALGWNRGEGILKEVFAGIVGYLALLPLFLVGVLCTLLLSVLIGAIEQWLGREPPGPMTHPIMEQLVGGDLKTLLLLLSLAAVWAPLVEETVFRGAYFHHLRGRWGVVLSSLVTGFVFAIIHPQGFAAVPALMSLGVSFALLREWRGSLIAPIAAHAMHNGFLVTMLWLALS
jgi:membrane protease YdiL (CAAX protease family)